LHSFENFCLLFNQIAFFYELLHRKNGLPLT
jgi:hypothetical protein